MEKGTCKFFHKGVGVQTSSDQKTQAIKAQFPANTIKDAGINQHVLTNTQWLRIFQDKDSRTGLQGESRQMEVKTIQKNNNTYTKIDE